jgi:hypothetical protein
VRRVLRLIVGSVLAASMASSALACTIIMDPSPPNLSLAEMRVFVERQFYERDLASQSKHWADADYVFLAEVRSLRFVGEDDVATELKPIASLKGDAGTGLVRDRYSPGFGSTCGPTPYPGIGETAIFYGKRLPWWRRLLHWGRPEVTSVLPLRKVVDRQIPVELAAAAARLRNTSVK